MASFLQFCATCERQIVTPDASILYCSEACRKKDNSTSSSLHAFQDFVGLKSPFALFHSTTSFFDHPPVNILPQRSPTVLQPRSINYFPEEDPSSPSEETSQCLDHHHEIASKHARRPPVYPASTITNTFDIHPPSLVHSPSSSWDTVGSNASYRPLPSRHHPLTASHRKSTSIDLASLHPHPASPTRFMKDASLKSCTSTRTSFRVAEAGDISYDKRSSISLSRNRSISHPTSDSGSGGSFMTRRGLV